jgi:anti-anti-sigma factor
MKWFDWNQPIRRVTMEILITTVQVRVPVTIMRIKGELDSLSAGYLNSQARDAIDQGAINILLDITAMPFMSSVGVRSLSAIYDWLHPLKTGQEQKSVSEAVRAGTYHAPHLKLLNPTPRVLSVIEMVALDRYLQIFYDETEALAAF